MTFGQTLGTRDYAEIAAYVALSLGAALAGSLAAISLVPLVQPGHGVPPMVWMAGAGTSVGRDALAFAASMTLFALFRWRVVRISAALVSRWGMNLRCMVHERLVDAPLVNLAGTTSAEIANVLTYNIEPLVQAFGATLQLAVIAVTTLVSLAFVFYVSPLLVLVSPALVGLGVLAARAFGRQQSEVSQQYVSDMTRLFWLSEDFPRRLRFVRSFERQHVEVTGYGAISARLRLGYRRQLELVAAGRLVVELIAAAGIAGTFLLADRWHGVDRASLVAAGLLLGRLLPYLGTSRQCFQQLGSAQPALDLWWRHMDLGRGATPPVVPRGMAVGEALHIDQLRLGAPLAALQAHDICLVPGQLVLISGDSGLGKSCLADVLAGMVEPAAFAGRVGGRRIDFEGYRALVSNGAYASQDVRPWQRTVRECLQWAAPSADEAAMQRAIDEVGLGPWLSASAEGLDTELSGTSSRLSGGELQRLMVAQVMLRSPFLVVLDEATGALDPPAELAVLAALKHRLPRSILIVISHRSAVARIADCRWVVHKDRITAVPLRSDVQTEAVAMPVAD